MFLEGVLADMAGADGGDGRFVDDGAAVGFVCHDCFLILFSDRMVLNCFVGWMEGVG